MALCRAERALSPPSANSEGLLSTVRALCQARGPPVGLRSERPSVGLRGPSVWAERALCRAERVLSPSSANLEGPLSAVRALCQARGSCQARGPFVGLRGPSVGLKGPSVGLRVPSSLSSANFEDPLSSWRALCRAERAFFRAERVLCRTERALNWASEMNLRRCYSVRGHSVCVSL